MQLDKMRGETYDVHYKFDIEGKVVFQNAPNDIRRNIIPGMAYKQSTPYPVYMSRNLSLLTKMCNIVYRGAARIPSDLLSFRVQWNKIILPPSQRIVNL